MSAATTTTEPCIAVERSTLLELRAVLQLAERAAKAGDYPQAQEYATLARARLSGLVEPSAEPTKVTFWLIQKTDENGQAVLANPHPCRDYEAETYVQNAARFGVARTMARVDLTLPSLSTKADVKA